MQIKAQFTDATVYGYLVSIKGVGEKLVKTGTATVVGTIAVNSNVEIKASDVTVTKIAKMALTTTEAATKNWTPGTITLTFNRDVDATTATSTAITLNNGSSAVSAADYTISVSGNVVTLTVVGGVTAGWKVTVNGVADAAYSDNAVASTILTLA